MLSRNVQPSPFPPVTDTINHVMFVIDASASMRDIEAEVVKVTDRQVKDLADLSQQLDQETRVSVYVFSEGVWCLFYDKDVLRLPSLAGKYRTVTNTALIDATVETQAELAQTATLHGDHAFLVYVITDGAENASKLRGPDLQRMLKGLPDNWTVACLVPNQSAKFTAEKYGFARGNIQIWDATSEAGMREAGRVMRDSTAGYMTARASGLKSTTGLFSMDSTVVNHKTVTANLKELTGFRVERVKQGQPAVIKEFIESLRPKVPFVQGANYFPLIKRERINDSKEILVRHIMSGKIYGGPQARTLVGLPDTGEVSVSPQPNSEFEIFVQSSSLNRKLIPGHDLLIKV
jgi:hypothetical protein